MPTFIQHRVNSPAALHDCDPAGGVEIDLRSSVRHRGVLHLSHDPWTPGADLREWLAAYRDRGIHGPLVLNTKEDGLEETIVAMLGEFGIDHYFFLDTTPPTLARCLARGWGPHMSVRLSRYEPAAAVQPWFDWATQQGRLAAPGWVWVDCFDGVPLKGDALAPLAAHAQLCLVSPELQQQPLERIRAFQHLAPMVDAICTKSPSAWHATLGAQAAVSL